MLWPDHCVQGTRGCEIHEEVNAALDKRRRNGDPGFVEIIQKGQDPKVDGYSAFSKNSYVSFTPLVRKLAARGIERVFVVGLATDYCCHASALDARKFGFETIIVKNAMKGVDAEGSKAAIEELQKWGCIAVDSADDALKVLAGA
jgi:nicotinamidase-related amidase